MLPVWTQVIGTSLAQNFAHVNGNCVLIVGEKGTLPVSVTSHDNSMLYRRPLKYKMATISVLNPMQSPEKILVGVIKTARHPGVKIDHGFTFFSVTPIVYDNGRAEK